MSLLSRLSKGGYSKAPREIIKNPAVTPQKMLNDRRNEGVGMDGVDNQDTE
jgi:hypothetical protein